MSENLKRIAGALRKGQSHEEALNERSQQRFNPGDKAILVDLDLADASAWVDEETGESIKAHEGETVTIVDEEVDNFWNIRFDDGSEFTGISGLHLRKAKSKLNREAQRSEDVVEVLQDAYQTIWEAVNSAERALQGTSEYSRAKSYWIPHILGALGGDAQGGYLGGSMCTLSEAIEALQNDEEDDGLDYR